MDYIFIADIVNRLGKLSLIHDEETSHFLKRVWKQKTLPWPLRRLNGFTTPASTVVPLEAIVKDRPVRVKTWAKESKPKLLNDNHHQSVYKHK